MAGIRFNDRAGLTWDDQRCWRCGQPTLRTAELRDDHGRRVAITVRCSRCRIPPSSLGRRAGDSTGTATG